MAAPEVEMLYVDAQPRSGELAQIPADAQSLRLTVAAADAAEVALAWTNALLLQGWVRDLDGPGWPQLSFRRLRDGEPAPTGDDYERILQFYERQSASRLFIALEYQTTVRAREHQIAALRHETLHLRADLALAAEMRGLVGDLHTIRRRIAPAGSARQRAFDWSLKLAGRSERALLRMFDARDAMLHRGRAVARLWSKHP